MPTHGSSFFRASIRSKINRIMSERPKLTKGLSRDEFLSYYYEKCELAAFCKKNGLPCSGGKVELTERISRFLQTGEIVKPSAKPRGNFSVEEITADTVIQSNYVCSQKSREFFKNAIGKRFSFNVQFQDWLKQNAGKTHADAVEAYKKILADGKDKKKEIGAQFEYNTYIRDFFADNDGRTLDEAITCWKYKREQKGHNRYERADLIALDKNLARKNPDFSG